MRKLWRLPDCQAFGFPADWVEQIIALSERTGETVHLDGTHHSSREAADFAGSDVNITNGEQISESIPWLFEAYTSSVLEAARELSGYDLEPSKDLKSSIVINHLKGPCSGYERHVDTNPLTGLIFVNSLPKDSGGDLVFDFDDGPERVEPRSGQILFFDAREIPHYVGEITKKVDRLSVPMNFYFSGTTLEEILSVVPDEYAMGAKGNV